MIGEETFNNDYVTTINLIFLVGFKMINEIFFTKGDRWGRRESS